MAIQFACPSCKTTYTVNDRDAGKKADCKKCGQRIQVPAPTRNKTVLGESLPASSLDAQAPPLPAANSGKRRYSRDDEPERFECASDDRYDDRDYRDESYAPRRKQPTPGMALAIIGLILGCLSIVLSIASGVPVLCSIACCCAAFLPLTWVMCLVAGLMGIGGVILGFVSRSAGNRSSLPILAIVISGVGVLFAILGLILTLAFPAALIATAPEQGGQVGGGGINVNAPDDPWKHAGKGTTERTRPATKTTSAPGKKTVPGTKTAPGGKKLYTRDEFRSMLLGKTPEQVELLIGRPESTETIRGETIWTYRGWTIDPMTGSPDGKVQVNFERGQVTSVTH